MPTLRFDYATADWVIFAPLRHLRPRRGETASPAVPGEEALATCPFCPGNEAMTPREIFAMRTGPDLRDWQVRVIPNKFPALAIEEDYRRTEEVPMSGTWEAAARMKSSSSRPATERPWRNSRSSRSRASLKRCGCAT